MASQNNPFSGFSDWSRGRHVTQDRPIRAKEFFLEMLKENLSACPLGSPACPGLWVLREEQSQKVEEKLRPRPLSVLLTAGVPEAKLAPERLINLFVASVSLSFSHLFPRVLIQVDK